MKRARSVSTRLLHDFGSDACASTPEPHVHAAMTLDVLRPFLERKRAQEHARKRCEICASPIDETHPHLLERETRKILCSCGPCAILFKDVAASSGRLHTVPDRVLVDDATPIPDETWATLAIPVGLAFLSYDSWRAWWTAAYPSPAGPVRAEISAAAWDAFAGALPLARHVQPDVEALVLRRGRGGKRECFIAPIDTCYGLVGAIRMRWKGITGGDDVRAAIDAFFEELRARARELDTTYEPGFAAR